jgi:hypothetical protein
MKHNPTITIEITWDADEGTYVAADVEDVVDDICTDADTYATVEDTGIGSYEYWGCQGVDTCIEVTKVTGEVTIDVTYQVMSYSPADAARLDNGDDIVAGIVAAVMADFDWPSVSTSGAVNGPRRDFHYDVSWSTDASGYVTQVTYEASLG